MRKMFLAAAAMALGLMPAIANADAACTKVITD